MTTESIDVRRYKLEQARKGAGSWFAWIGGLSLLNSVLADSGKQFSFTFGLGISQIGDAFLAQKSPIKWLLGFFLAYGFAGLFILLSWLARHTMVAFPIGTVVYALDTVIFLFAQDWLGLGFHVFALFLIVGGWQATRKLQSELEQSPAIPASLTAPSIGASDQGGAG